MKKIYEAIDVRIFSMSIEYNGKSIRLAFDDGDRFRSARFGTCDEDIQESIEKSPLFNTRVRLFSEEKEKVEVVKAEVKKAGRPAKK